MLLDAGISLAGDALPYPRAALSNTSEGGREIVGVRGVRASVLRCGRASGVPCSRCAGQGVPGEGAATRRLITNLDLLATCVYGSGDEAPLLTQDAVKYMEIPKSSYVSCAGSVVKGEQGRQAKGSLLLPVRRDRSSGVF